MVLCDTACRVLLPDPNQLLHAGFICNCPADIVSWHKTVLPRLYLIRPVGGNYRPGLAHLANPEKVCSVLRCGCFQ